MLRAMEVIDIDPLKRYVDEHLKSSKLFKYQLMTQLNPVFEEKLKFWRPKLVYQDPSRFHLLITVSTRKIRQII